MKYQKSIYIALDGMPKKEMMGLVKKLQASPYAYMLAGWKIHDAWDRYGPSIIQSLKHSGAKNVWLDIKLHDTPSTIAFRSKAAAQAGADMVSVHASSGARALLEAKKSNIKIAAISVLTSLDKKEIQEIYGVSPKKQVLRLASVAKQSKAFAIVCSKEEIQEVLEMDNKIKVIVPGIKMSNKKDFNQKRVGTPKDAFHAGAAYIVIGSAITQAKNPAVAFEKIVKSLL